MLGTQGWDITLTGKYVVILIPKQIFYILPLDTFFLHFFMQKLS